MAEGRRIRVPEEHYEIVSAFVSFLTTWHPSHDGTQEEEKKEKEPKRNKKKEEKTTTTTTREARIFVKPTVEEIRIYLEEKQVTTFSAEYFFNYYEAIGWTYADKQIIDWKSVVDIWIENNHKDRKRNEQKQKSKNAKTPSDARDGDRENGEPQEVASQEPNLPRRELVEKILREKYPVDEAQAERMAAVVENAKGGARRMGLKHCRRLC